MDTENRKFTRPEVARILRRAVAIEQAGSVPEDVAGGLTLAELREIAREVGIQTSAIDAATSELDVLGASSEAGWLGPSSTRRTSHVLAANLTDEDRKVLLRCVEHRLKRAGTASEAFGQLRWVSTSAQLTTEVVLTQGEGTVQIEVAQRYPSQVRPLLHIIPGAAGAAVAVSIGAPAGVLGVPLILLTAGGGILGALIGRAVWYMMSWDSDRRTKSLASELATTARALASGEVGSQDPREP
jgi:hypothetical protein